MKTLSYTADRLRRVALSKAITGFRFGAFFKDGDDANKDANAVPAA